MPRAVPARPALDLEALRARFAAGGGAAPAAGPPLHYTVGEVCAALGIPRSTFYATPALRALRVWVTRGRVAIPADRFALYLATAQRPPRR